jgi:predicted enzyme related to lactoylglutathione lyase
VENVDVRIEFTLDCADLDRMTRFWRDAVGFVVVGVIEGRYVSLRGHDVALTLQQVEEPKTVKNRMHLDLLVDDVELEVSRLEELGASRLTPTAREEFGQTWFVLADPEGNEFCVARESSGIGPPNG